MEGHKLLPGIDPDHDPMPTLKALRTPQLWRGTLVDGAAFSLQRLLTTFARGSPLDLAYDAVVQR